MAAKLERRPTGASTGADKGMRCHSYQGAPTLVKRGSIEEQSLELAK